MESCIRCKEQYPSIFSRMGSSSFFERMWSKGLERYDELEGIGWEWQNLDGCMVKAPLALESVENNPTYREKMGPKCSVLTDENGLPLAGSQRDKSGTIAGLATRNLQQVANVHAVKHPNL